MQRAQREHTLRRSYATPSAPARYARVASTPAASGDTPGRLLTPADDRPDAPPVLVISHAYWNRRFGADPGVLGRTIAVNGSVLRDTLILVGAGLTVGFLATFPAGLIVSDQLFGLDPGAVDVRLNATLVIVGMSFLAAYLPARRASRVDPMLTLRSD